MSSSVYDLLTGIQIDGLTTGELDFITKTTFVDSTNTDFWGPLLQLSHVLKASRTYSHGLPIPESGAVVGNEIDDGSDATFIPTGTEVWAIQNIDLQGCTAALRDVSSGSMSQLTSSTFQSGTVYLSASLGLYFNNGSGSPKTPTFAYYKVSL
jgi:hypothetical protein